NDLKHAVVIDVSGADNKSVYIGCKVKLFDYEFDEEVEYYIVGSKEADVRNGKISDASPIGKALIGKELGEEFEITVGDEKFKYKVLEINNA
ncbi:MAG: GreA/GreB family elongation factor, partial [Clostridia bacterium]|nr:GreA/GreB family elongation factor [Clostridia bacterium]